jgi:dihydrodipicolinate synthase/N-acetylneuraminate lyase
MTARQEVDIETLGAFADRLVDAGVHGLVALGSTGEFYALDPGERRDVLRTAIDAARGRVPVLAGANAGATREVVAYARAARMRPALEFIERSGRYTQLVKAGCAALGHPVGPPRAPLRAVGPDLAVRLARLIEGLD